MIGSHSFIYSFSSKWSVCEAILVISIPISDNSFRFKHTSSPLVEFSLLCLANEVSVRLADCCFVYIILELQLLSSSISVGTSIELEFQCG